MEQIKLQEIHYLRQVRPPTLKQYLLRRAVREAMNNVKGTVGVTVNPETGLPIPASALVAKEALKGLNADKILQMHPEWEKEYYEQYQSKP